MLSSRDASVPPESISETTSVSRSGPTGRVHSAVAGAGVMGMMVRRIVLVGGGAAGAVDTTGMVVVTGGSSRSPYSQFVSMPARNDTTITGTSTRPMRQMRCRMSDSPPLMPLERTDLSVLYRSESIVEKTDI